MTEPDPLEQRLAGLGEAPGPALAPPSGVRARGDRRRRRARTALAATAVVAVVGLGGAATLLTGGSGQDALQQAGPTGEPVPDCEELGIPAPPEDGETVVYGGSYGPYRSELTCTFDPRPSIVPVPEDAPPPPGPDPTAPSRPAPAPAPAAWEPAAALLSPEQAGAAERPGWVVDAAYAPAAAPLLDPCARGAFSGALVARADRAMSSERDAGGSRLVQQVVRYGGEPEAATAFDALLADVTACPEAPPVEGPGALRYSVVGLGGVDGARTALVEVQPCGVSGDCTAHFRSYLMVAQHADGLNLAFYGLAEDGDPFEAAKDLLDVVAAQLARTAR